MPKNLFILAERQHKRLLEEIKQESRLPLGLEGKIECTLDNYKDIIHELLKQLKGKN